MNFLKKIYYRRRAKKDFEKRLLMSSASHQTTMDVLHYMCSAVGIDEMRKMLDEAEKSGNKYINLAGMYASVVNKRIYGKK